MKDFYDLYNLYSHVNKMGWVKSLRKGPGGIGYTFETLIGKEEEDFPIPDFNSIEIKTMRYKSKKTLHLFTLTPDGDYLFPIKRILDTLGYPSKWNRDYKMLMVNVNAKEYSFIGLSKKIRLNVNRKEQKIELLAFKSNGEEIDIDVSWSFDWLKQVLEAKLNNLAVIKAYHKIIAGQEYFNYSNISFYKLKSFETFISLIYDGVINVTFNIDIFKSGRRIGQVHDHGTSFWINLDNIDLLYKKINLDL